MLYARKQARDTGRAWRAAHDSRACQPCPLFSPGQNRSGESTADCEAQARQGALGGAGSWALILPLGLGALGAGQCPPAPLPSLQTCALSI